MQEVERRIGPVTSQDTESSEDYEFSHRFKEIVLLLKKFQTQERRREI